MYLDRLDIQVERLLILSSLGIQTREIGVRDFSERVYAKRLVIEVNRLVNSLLCSPGGCKPHIGARIVRVEIQRREKPGLSFLEPGSAAGLVPNLVF